MRITNMLAGVAVKDLDQSIAWYALLIGSAPVRRDAEIAEWRFDGGCCLRLVRRTSGAAGGSVTMVVEDLDQQLELMDGAGLRPTRRQDADAVRIAFLRDPDGNQLVLAQVLSAALAC
ncbi:VOC family protein [uncultured Pseudacidovorax sp.]|uniref:VOC family protein n=1 Tax=uncultured Pseudacidovorax sp. TaxID=679313 RepID=UPI0025EAEBA8|nr:VOC family protein [uncultured Pseudacidovorax sp.]